MDKKFEYTIMSDEVNEIFDEKGSIVLALRKVQWGNGAPKLDMRKWTVGMGKEDPGKGFAFLTEEGPHNLTTVLCKNGYGKTKDILTAIKDRDDFHSSIQAVTGNKLSLESAVMMCIDEDEETNNEITYYDPKEHLF